MVFAMIADRHPTRMQKFALFDDEILLFARNSRLLTPSSDS